MSFALFCFYGKHQHIPGRSLFGVKHIPILQKECLWLEGVVVSWLGEAESWGDGMVQVLLARGTGRLPPGLLSGVCADIPLGGHGLLFPSLTKVSCARHEKTSGHISHLLPHMYVLLPHMHVLLISCFSGVAQDGLESARKRCHSSGT